MPVAVESRSSYEQVPSEREMLRILDDFPAPWVGYWHDFGHVQLKANLGLLECNAALAAEIAVAVARAP